MQPIVESDNKTRKYCQYCRFEITYGTENNICGFCEAYFEDEKEQNKLKKIYHEFKDVIDYNSKFKRITDEENKKINRIG